MSIRRKKPVRSTGLPKYSNYGRYKEHLREDFNKRCGYCDSDDHYFGGRRGYQIDHFAPKSIFPSLENTYSNLVYSCFFCNNSKRDYWASDSHEVPIVGDCGLVDPCTDHYEEHLVRNGEGEIIPQTELGKFIFKKLKLGLARHALIWKLEKLKCMMQEIDALIEELDDSEEVKELYVEYHNMSRLFFKYLNAYNNSI